MNGYDMRYEGWGEEEEGAVDMRHRDDCAANRTALAGMPGPNPRR